MTVKIELAIVGAALFGLGAFVAMQGASASEADAPKAIDHFSQADFNAFDRGFAYGDGTCSVGLKRHEICFGKSPYEAALTRGQVLSQRVPAISAEFRVIVETELKSPNLQTTRFGQTLVLIDPETRIVHDILHLDAPDYDTGQREDYVPS